jgi:hypothetical protein
MATQGHTTVDFGAFPGSSDASVAVTGQAGILASSDVEAWIRCEASADHSSDEHMLETINCVAKDIVAGTGFTIHCLNTSQLSEPLERLRSDKTVKLFTPVDPSIGGIGTRLYGVFNVSWVWN